ncbi:MAG TPA: hypothetical protein VN310_12055 [Candidatus Dormibacteraeota bacterium]|nr:hypothetical protein [Candidatus Dormibacteraeota bacterium]
MKSCNLFLLYALLLVCSSCTNLKSQKVTDENKDKLISEIATSKDLTDEERQLLSGYIVRQNVSSIFQGGKPSIPAGKTIGEMIEDQRKWVAQQTKQEAAEKEKQQKLSAEIAAKETALREFVTVTLYSLKESDYSGMAGFEARIAFKAGSKDIRAFQGELVLSDVLGNSLGELPVKVLTPLKANQSGTTGYSNLYMAFGELRGKRLEDIKAQWKPTKIIFADSAELSLPESPN